MLRNWTKSFDIGLIAIINQVVTDFVYKWSSVLKSRGRQHNLLLFNEGSGGYTPRAFDFSNMLMFPFIKHFLVEEHISQEYC